MTNALQPPPRARVEELLDRMRGIRAAVIGDVMLDRYLQGDVERISPEAPVPVLSVEEEWVAAGGAANVAANVAAAGGSPLLVGAVGDDEAASQLRKHSAAMRSPQKAC